MGLRSNQDKMLELVVYAVLQMRKEFLAKLTTARIEARKFLFKKILFLVEKVAAYGNLAAAKADGCWFEFVADGAPGSQLSSQIAPGQLWQIDLCERVVAMDNDIDKADKRKRNHRKCEDLSKLFPFLTIFLHWRKYATNPTTEQREYLPMTESWSLYKVAADCVLAAYKVEDLDDFLSLSDLSLRALHIHAVGYYAMLRKFCGHDLCPVEVSCLVYLSWKYLPSYVEESDFNSRRMPGRTSAAPANTVHGTGNRMFEASSIQEAPVTCMYGGRTNVESDNEERPSLLMTYRKEHFEFASWEAFESEIRSCDEASQAQGTGETTAISGFGLSGTVSMDLGDLDWPGQSGR